MSDILLLCQGYQNLSIAHDLLSDGHKLDIIVPTGHPEYEIMKNALSKLDNAYVVDTRDQFLNLLDELVKTRSYDYIFPTFPDHHMKLIAELNQKFNIPGINLQAYEKLKEKINYYPIWEKLGISVPTTYQTVANKETLDHISTTIDFPCLVKPSGGMSGLGIKIITSQNDLVDFFKDVDVKVHDYQEQHGTRFKNFEYYSADTDYLIQEYVNGPVVSVIGHVFNKEVSLDLLYDIEANCYPYAAETALIYPSKYTTVDLIEYLKLKLELFVSEIDLDNCPFMLDIIIKDGAIYFIDFAPRMSAGAHLLKYAGEEHYASKLTKKMLNGSVMHLNLHKCSMKKGLSLKPGTIDTIAIKEEQLAEYIKLPTNNKVNLPRNDVSISNNGYVYMSGTSLEELENKYRLLIQSMEVVYL